MENAKKAVLSCVASCFELFSNFGRSCVECAAGGEGACRAKRLRSAWKARKHGCGRKFAKMKEFEIP